jgi:oligoribonuclease NrnB/cAMP/cGMP phosphodiesterase (DHH superfamily)
MSNSTFVLYHGGNCADGYGSAWSASRALGRGPDVVYAPMNYGSSYPPEIDGGADAVYILDFSFPRDVMLRLAGVANRVVCLDHHATAQAALDGLDGAAPGLTVRFDMGKSGAMLTWEYFHPGKPVPYLIELIQDRDLWRWQLPDSKVYNAAIASYPKTFDTWDWLMETLAEEPGDKDRGGMFALLREGAAILRYQQSLIETFVQRARIVNLCGHDVPVVNAPVLQSEVGDVLCAAHPRRPFAAMFSVLAPDRPGEPEGRVYSLRSRNGFDVSAVAKSMGGGGHRAAAGFTVREPKP